MMHSGGHLTLTASHLDQNVVNNERGCRVFMWLPHLVQQRREVALDEDRLPVKKVHVRLRNLPVHQQQQPCLQERGAAGVSTAHYSAVESDTPT